MVDKIIHRKLAIEQHKMRKISTKVKVIGNNTVHIRLSRVDTRKTTLKYL